MNQIKIRFGENFETGTIEDKSFEEIFQAASPVFCLSKQVWKPQMDIFETDSKIIIQAEIAGVGKSDIDIEVSAKAVKISGTRRISQPEPAASYRLAEIQYGQFERVLHLPALIDVTKVFSHFNNGFLELTLGKMYGKDPVLEQNIAIDLV
ncbi:MAG: Hsp20/alpha crystallin family protein [Desulfobacterales bacterium]|nr:Hsp20/alpha crystallin family protein [Desulfobacterales bacterium]